MFRFKLNRIQSFKLLFSTFLAELLTMSWNCSCRVPKWSLPYHISAPFCCTTECGADHHAALRCTTSAEGSIITRGIRYKNGMVATAHTHAHANTHRQYKWERGEYLYKCFIYNRNTIIHFSGVSEPVWNGTCFVFVQISHAFWRVQWCARHK